MSFHLLASLQRNLLLFSLTYLDARPSALHTKVFVTDWLSDLVKSSSHTKAPTAVIQELAKVFPTVREFDHDKLFLIISKTD